MQIQVEDPEGFVGLLEDINPEWIETGQIMDAVQRSIARVEDAVGPRPKGMTYEAIYRKWSRHLKAIAGRRNEHQEDAKRLLRRLMLLQTLPFDELEHPFYVDGYTGEQTERRPTLKLEDLDDIKEMIENPHENLRRLSTAASSISQWNDYIAQRAPYQRDEDNEVFIRANVEYPGEDEDEENLPLDDREHIPVYMIPECATDDNIQNIRTRLVPVIQGYFKDHEPAHLLKVAQILADEDPNPANLASVWLEWGLDVSGLGKRIKLHHEPVLHTLQDYYECFLPELTERVEACGSIPKEKTMTDREIMDEADRLMGEYLDAIEVHPTRPIVSRAWVKGYINGIMAGLPPRGGEYTATDAAWDSWRLFTCEAGQKAYQQAVARGASRREAMQAFYNIARREGKVASRPKVIVAVRPSGLVLQGDRMVSWNIALRIMHEEGFALSSDEKARLKSILEAKGWAPAFTAQL